MIENRARDHRINFINKFGILRTAAEIAGRVYPYTKTWDKALQTVLAETNLSPEAQNFIYSENRKTESGRQGFIGCAIYLMEGYNPNLPVFSKIWMDSSFHIFALRVIDDYVDEDYDNLSTLAKLRLLDWEAIKENRRENVYRSPQEEASVYFFGECVKRLGSFGLYLSKFDQLVKAAIQVEEYRDCSQLAASQIDMNVAVLTAAPIIEIVRGNGFDVSAPTEQAIAYLTRGTRIMDHLGDLTKDLASGAYNSLVINEGEEKIGDLWTKARNQAPAYFRKAIFEFKEGSKLLDGKSKNIYNTLAGLVIMKYGIQYLLNLNPNVSHWSSLITRRVLRSL